MATLVFHANEKNLDGWNYIPQNNPAHLATITFGVETKYNGKCLKSHHIDTLRELGLRVVVSYRRDRFGHESGDKNITEFPLRKN